MVCVIYISNSDLYIVQNYAVTNTLLLLMTIIILCMQKWDFTAHLWKLWKSLIINNMVTSAEAYLLSILMIAYALNQMQNSCAFLTSSYFIADKIEIIF